MSTWNDKRLDEGFKEAKEEMRAGFAQVDQRFEKVDQRFEKVDQRFEKIEGEMRAGFAQTVTRDEMNERFNAVDKRLNDLTRWVQVLVVVGGGAIVGNGIFG